MFANEPHFLSSDIYCITMWQILGRCLGWLIFCTSFGGKNYFLLWNIGSVTAQKRDSTCSKQREGLVEICQPVHRGVKICSAGREEGVILFCCTRTGCNMHCFYIVRAFILLKSSVQEPCPVHSVLNLMWSVVFKLMLLPNLATKPNL